MLAEIVTRGRGIYELTLTGMDIKTVYLQFLRCVRYTGAAKLDDLLEICPKVLENLVSVPAI